MTTSETPAPVERRDQGIQEIDEWVSGYVKRHPQAAISTVGEQAVLAVRTIQYLFVDLFTGKFQWQEFIRQAAFMAGTSVVPTIFVALPIGVTLSVQFALLAGQVGATSLSGAASGLGSRKIRDEIDALEVLGISVVQRLVVPRFVAAILIAVALTGLVCFTGFLASYLFNVYFQNGAPGSFVATFASFTTTDDLILAMFKAVVYGAIVAIVACQKGLSTRGGSIGVANSVNSSVVESILLLMIVNVAISQMYLILFPKSGL
jgi:phospholipid/cholesterol/gamma-HCH transport system permease protein